nr:LysR family transcriptional regulator YfeR [Raoultella sp. NCTC 9187]
MLHDRPQQWVLESIRQGEVDFGIVIDPAPRRICSVRRSCLSRFCFYVGRIILLPKGHR